MFENLKNLFTNQKTQVMNETQNEVAYENATSDPAQLNSESDNATSEPSLSFEPGKALDYSVLNLDDNQLLNAPEIVGWTSTEEQELLFSALLLFYTHEHSVLDVGAGRCDLYDYLQKTFAEQNPTINYKGIDYNPNVLQLGKQKYGDINTEGIDILDLNPEEKFDWVFASGIFNLNDYPDMETYIKQCVDKMYNTANIGVAFNVLTALPADISEEEQNELVVHEPGDWLTYLISTYTKVMCRADYLSGDVTFYIFK